MPHIVLVEANLDDLLCGQLIRGLRPRFPNTLLLVLTARPDEHLLASAIQTGAVGYIIKSSGEADAIGAMDEALAGGSPLSPHIARQVLHLLRASNPPFGSE